MHIGVCPWVKHEEEGREEMVADIPNFSVVSWRLREFSVSYFASSNIALNFFHCAFAFSVTSH